MNDSQLLHLYLTERSEAAFRELVSRHSGLVYGTALRRLGGDAHLAQDAAQRVFLALVRKAAALQGRDNLAGWLHSAARLEAAQLVRSEVRRKRREETSTMEDSTEADASWDQLVPMIDETVAELDAKDREPVLLRYFSGKTHSEIAAALGTTEESARKRVERAVEKLRDRFRRRGIVSSAAALGVALEGHAATPISAALEASIANAVWPQAAASSSTAFGLFMATNKALVGFAVAALAVGVTCLTKDAFAHRDALARSQQAADSAAGAEQKARVLQAQAAGLQKLPAARRPSSAPQSANSFAADPDYKKTNLQLSLLGARLLYRSIFHQMKLSPAQADQMVDLLVAQTQARLEALAVAQSGGDPQSVYRQSGTLTQQGINGLLTPDQKAQFDSYLKSSSVYRFVDQLSLALPPSEPALSQDQADQMVSLALANDSHFQQGHGTDPSQVDWDSVWDPASKILDDAQLAVLKTKVEAQTLDRDINKRVNKVSGAAR